MRVRSTLRTLVAMATLGIMLAVVSTSSATTIGNQGCTPGFWKNNPGAWEEYVPTQKVSTVFSAAPAPDRSHTLMQALQGGGGHVHILLRAGTASFLNAAHEGIGYPYRRWASPGNLHSTIQAALRSGNRQTMLDLAARLDRANNLGCPLSADASRK